MRGIVYFCYFYIQMTCQNIILRNDLLAEIQDISYSNIIQYVK